MPPPRSLSWRKLRGVVISIPKPKSFLSLHPPTCPSTSLPKLHTLHIHHAQPHHHHCDPSCHKYHAGWSPSLPRPCPSSPSGHCVAPGALIGPPGGSPEPPPTPVCSLHCDQRPCLTQHGYTVHASRRPTIKSRVVCWPRRRVREWTLPTSPGSPACLQFHFRSPLSF